MAGLVNMAKGGRRQPTGALPRHTHGAPKGPQLRGEHRFQRRRRFDLCKALSAFNALSNFKLLEHAYTD
eukprot:1968885-Alexandrium_andersonii.AAC.1